MLKIPVIIQVAVLMCILGTAFIVYEFTKPSWVAFEINAQDTKFFKECADRMGKRYKVEGNKVYFEAGFLFNSEHTCYSNRK